MKKVNWLNEYINWNEIQHKFRLLKEEENKEFNRLKKLLGLNPKLGNKDIVTEKIKLKIADEVIGGCK